MKQENALTECTDSNNGKKDKWGDDCSWYQRNPWRCGKYDDDDFNANIMCCACKGDV